MGKQVKTPRFYVDMVTFLHATGMTGWADSDQRGGAELLYMNPSNPYIREQQSNPIIFRLGIYNQNQYKTSFPINFVALLNHNLASDSNPFLVQGIRQDWADNNYTGHVWDTLTDNSDYKRNILNGNQSNPNIVPQYNGTTIFEIKERNELWTSFFLKYDSGFDDTINHQLGSLVVGKYWDAPNSPDLSLTMSRRFDGIKKQKTIGGKTLANIYYDGPTEWTMNHPIDNDLNGTYKYPPFELDTTAQVDTQGFRFDYRAKSGLGRKGLRSWNLTFSYISEDNMWMDNEVSSKLTGDSINDDIYGGNPTGGDDPNPMLTDDSFNFVWNCTLGGTLPFIFQPNAPQYDSAGVMTQGDNSPDQFSICTFRQNTLSVKQVAYNTYTLSITIDEVA